MFEYKLDAACLRFYLLTGMGLPAGLLQAFAETIFAQSTTATSAGKNNGPDVCDVWKKNVYTGWIKLVGAVLISDLAVLSCSLNLSQHVCH